MKKNIQKIIFSTWITVIPSAAFAKGIEGFYNDKVIDLLNGIVGILTSLGVLFFMYQVFSYITAGGDSTKRKDASRYMLYGIVSLLVIVSLWGFVNLLLETTGFQRSLLPPAK